MANFYFFQEVQDSIATSNKTKKEIFSDLTVKVKQALLLFPSDGLLRETISDLEVRTEKSFKLKEDLLVLDSSIRSHIKDLEIELDLFTPVHGDTNIASQSDEEEELLDF